jgi:two-component system, OmpR family, alkaline phosphatase synthesis response regulator PhoP
MTAVLIVEDEKHLADGLRFNIEAEGYRVEVTDNGEDALDLLTGEGEAFDAVVLDVMLPGKDGFTVVSELRQAGQFVPVLILTARGHPEDVLRGFEAGADDYLPKPFELAILLARLRGLIRRREWLSGTRGEPSATASEQGSKETDNRSATADRDEVYAFDGKTIDFGALEIRAGDRTVQLTLMEAQLLRHLIKHAGKIVSRKSLLEEVWGLREDTDTRAIDNFIVRLRKYIEDEPSRPRWLLTVRGVGYRFVADPDDGSQ